MRARLSMLLLAASIGCGAKTPLADLDVLPAVEGSHAALEVALGSHHTCARLTDGAVKCWGAGDHGQLGDRTLESSLVPKRVVELSDVTQLALGGGHTCALRADGTVLCWGDRSVGEVGDGSPLWSSDVPTSVLVPVQVVGLSRATAIAAGDAHTCARRGDGGVSCWGINDIGELGDEAGERSSTPQRVSGIASARAIALGASHTCALDDGGLVLCWGANDVGQLGTLTTETCGTYPCSRHAIDLPSLDSVRGIALGGSTSCVVRDDGSVWCWGHLLEGLVATPTVVAGMADAVEVAVGRFHVCARTSRGEVWCWGSNANGQLGTASIDPCPSGALSCGRAPKRVTALPSVVQLAVGGDHSCARTSEGDVWCWGANEEGEVGDGTRIDRVAPVKLAL